LEKPPGNKKYLGGLEKIQGKCAHFQPSGLSYYLCLKILTLMNEKLQIFLLVMFLSCQVLLGQEVIPQINNSFHNLTEETSEKNFAERDLFKNRVVPIFMMITGAGMAGIWAADIAGGKFLAQGNFFKWREGENLLWPHILAETLTAAGLITGGIGLYNAQSWAVQVSLASLGALSYSTINSTGWVLAEKERLPYGIPMWVSLAGAGVSFVILIK
jgi:hypothetical protein